MRANSGAIWANFRLGLHLAMTNRADQVGMVLVYLTLMLVFFGIFSVFPVDELGIPGLTSDHLWWYTAITEVIVVGSQGAGLELARIIGDGQITTHMQRPVHMMASITARMLGLVLVNVMILGFIGWLCLSLIADIPCPISMTELPLFLLSVMIGCVIFLICGYMISMLEILGPYSRPTNWILSKVMFTVGGIFFPVLLFPEPLRSIANLTPFPSILAAPGNFALDIIAHESTASIATQIIWLAILIGLAVFAERRMVNHVLVMGD